MSAYQWATVAVLAVVVWLLWALVHGGNRPEWPAMPADQRADFDQHTRAAQARIITPTADEDPSWLDEIVTDAEADLFMDGFCRRILAAIDDAEANDFPGAETTTTGGVTGLETVNSAPGSTSPIHDDLAAERLMAELDDPDFFRLAGE